MELADISATVVYFQTLNVFVVNQGFVVLVLLHWTLDLMAWNSWWKGGTVCSTYQTFIKPKYSWEHYRTDHTNEANYY